MTGPAGGRFLWDMVKKGNAAWLAAGRRLTSYVCPDCGVTVPIPRPAEKDVGTKGYWASARRCPECNKVNFVLVFPSGRTRVINPDGGKGVTVMASRFFVVGIVALFFLNTVGLVIQTDYRQAAISFLFGVANLLIFL